MFEIIDSYSRQMAAFILGQKYLFYHVKIVKSEYKSNGENELEFKTASGMIINCLSEYNFIIDNLCYIVVLENKNGVLHFKDIIYNTSDKKVLIGFGNIKNYL